MPRESPRVLARIAVSTPRVCTATLPPRTPLEPLSAVLRRVRPTARSPHSVRAGFS
jgi:hypothetical protein